MKFSPIPLIWSKDDIVFWSYSQKYIDSLSYKNDLYWAKSRIAVFNGEKFVDTYWNSGNNLSFTPEDIGDRFEIQYIGNFSDLDKQGNYAQFEDLEKYYDDDDIVDLNHPNSSRGNLYLRKGAKRSLTKIKKSLEYQIKRSQEKIDHLNWVLDQEKEKLANS
jgi:hypothetical protein